MDAAVRITADSAFGCAGQRCLATSLAITVGEARHTYGEAICDAAASRVVGNGLDAGVQMGPVINQLSKDRIEELIGKGCVEGAADCSRWSSTKIPGYEKGSFVKPTILNGSSAGK